MRHLSFLLLFAAFLNTSCKKDNKGETTYDERLEGTWDLKAVEYSGTSPNPSDPGNPINVQGEGTNVLGEFVLTRNPNKITYTYSFAASVQVDDTIPPIDVPLSQSGEGEWTTTSDESKLIITDTTGAIYTFNVLVNEEKKQVYETTVQEVIGGFIPVTADVILEFSKR